MRLWSLGTVRSQSEAAKLWMGRDEMGMIGASIPCLLALLFVCILTIRGAKVTHRQSPEQGARDLI